MKLRSFLKALIMTPFLFVLALKLHAQQTVQTMVVESQYLLYLPEGYNTDTSKRWPLLMFLHGSGEAGTDIAKVKVHGPPKLAENGKKFPFILVSPQAPPNTGWEPNMLYKLLQDVKKKYRVNNDKVYLTGLSMGGYGTFKLAMDYPDEFAAIAPVCGGGDTAAAWKLRNTPIWCFHGALDDVVKPEESENMLKAASRFNSNIRYTLYANKNHNSWDTTYDTNDSLYNWLLTQTRFRYKEVDVPAVVLKKYEGTYAAGNDTLRMMLNGNTLVVLEGRDTIPLKAASQELFFLEPDKTMDLRFITSHNVVSGFRFMGRQHAIYRKLVMRKK